MIIPKLFNIALTFSNKFNIDESHALGHCMNVLHYAYDIKVNECVNYPCLKNQDSIIYASAILHDICDKKYVNEESAWQTIESEIKSSNILTNEEVDIVHEIIRTMSYSKVKQYGFPDLGIYTMAYHVVREADLLAAYDFDRSLIYNMNNIEPNFIDSYINAHDIMDTRVLKHINDNLFITNHSKELAKDLETKVIKQMYTWNCILGNANTKF